MKKHTWVKLTLSHIKRLGPCQWGLEDARPFLPLDVSTDPDDNLDSAIALAEAGVDVEWLFDQYAPTEKSFPPTCPCSLCQDPGGAREAWTYRGQDEAYSNMQRLAYVADFIATQKGK